MNPITFNTTSAIPYATADQKPSTTPNEPTISSGIKQIDTAEISHNQKSSTKASDSPVTVSDKELVKEMFLQADPHQQVDLATTQLRKNQMEAYMANYSSNDEKKKSPAKVYIINRTEEYQISPKDTREMNSEPGSFYAIA
jgi:CRISPR/Cas system endoribonuclease Cas6 (RAMP superfamily)